MVKLIYAIILTGRVACAVIFGLLVGYVLTLLFLAVL